MPDFRVLAINHTSFTVSDIDRTLAFLREALGFEVLSKVRRDQPAMAEVTGVPGADLLIAYVAGAGHTLELIQYLQPAEQTGYRPRPCDVGFAHLAYDVDDIDAAITAAAAYDVLPVNPPSTVTVGDLKGGRVAYLRDPDGITFEFIQKP